MSVDGPDSLGAALKKYFFAKRGYMFSLATSCLVADDDPMWMLYRAHEICAATVRQQNAPHQPSWGMGGLEGWGRSEA